MAAGWSYWTQAMIEMGKDMRPEPDSDAMIGRQPCVCNIVQHVSFCLSRGLGRKTMQQERGVVWSIAYEHGDQPSGRVNVKW